MEKVVTFYEMSYDLEQTPIAKVFWDGKKITFKGRVSVKQMLERGVRVKGGKLYPQKDGEKFIDILPVAFAGSRFFATAGKS